jgi:hypothetical protein
MVSDLAMLWSLFCEVYELFCRYEVNFASFFAAHHDLVAEFECVFRSHPNTDSGVT